MPGRSTSIPPLVQVGEGSWVLCNGVAHVFVQVGFHITLELQVFGTRWWMGNFGAGSAKPHKGWSNDQGMLVDLHERGGHLTKEEREQIKQAQERALVRTTVTDGKRSFTGDKKALENSQPLCQSQQFVLSLTRVAKAWHGLLACWHGMIGWLLFGMLDPQVLPALIRKVLCPDCCIPCTRFATRSPRSDWG